MGERKILLQREKKAIEILSEKYFSALDIEEAIDYVKSAAANYLKDKN